MVLLQMRNNGKGHGKNKIEEVSQPNVEQMGLKKSFCGSTAGSDMLAWLKGVAVDPCEPGSSKDSIHKFQYQLFKLRQVWHSGDAECSERKRKLEQFLSGEKLTTSRFDSKNSSYQNVKKVTCKQTIRNSFGSNSALTFDDCFEGKQPPTDSNTSDDTRGSVPFTKDSSLVDSNESFNDSNLFSRENFIAQHQPSVDSNDLISISRFSNSDEKLQQAVNLLTTDSESESENTPRAVIPIGPKFQAEVSDWMVPSEKEYLHDSESLKWLGPKIWPIEEASPKSTNRKIGSGRRQFCTCVSPGSIECNRCHILSARHNLRSELGPAYLSWKFDEMGEIVSRNWTSKEQMRFETLVTTYLSSNKKGLWEYASKRLPSKSKKMILSYYHNVFNPRRMSRLTRSSPHEHHEVESDEDQVDDKYLQV